MLCLLAGTFEATKDAGCCAQPATIRPAVDAQGAGGGEAGVAGRNALVPAKCPGQGAPGQGHSRAAFSSLLLGFPP